MPSRKKKKTEKVGVSVSGTHEKGKKEEKNGRDGLGPLAGNLFAGLK